MLKVPVHIEVILRVDSNVSDYAEFNSLVFKTLQNSCCIFSNGQLKLQSQALSQYIDYICVTDLEDDVSVSFWEADLSIHSYKLQETSAERDFIEGGDGEDLPACLTLELPSVELHGLWDSIIVSHSIKESLLGYCASSMTFSEAQVDASIISWNRIIMLHGPPGTGKTTLCKALAQKTFIRNCDRYSNGILLEISSHSLFSKWFSESGKLVMKLFDYVKEVAEDEDCLVFVLIDEVESIVSSRTNSSSSDPGDAVRVVNAVLTCLDQLKNKKNILVLCTSNLADSIDEAFLDRVDLTVHIGEPCLEARYNILKSCLLELMSKGIICPTEGIKDFSSVNHMSNQHASRIDHDTDERKDNNNLNRHRGMMTNNDKRLLSIATYTEGMSGRALRKLPLKAHAHFLQRPAADYGQFLKALRSVLELEGKFNN